MNVKSNYGL